MTTDTHIAITNALADFAHCIDKRDWNTFATLFADPFDIDYSAFGMVTGRISPAQVAEEAAKSFDGFDATQHLIGSVSIRPDGDTVAVVAYVRAMHVVASGDDAVRFDVGARYDSIFTPSQDGWLISVWRFKPMWTQGDQGIFDLAARNLADKARADAAS